MIATSGAASEVRQQVDEGLAKTKVVLAIKEPLIIVIPCLP